MCGHVIVRFVGVGVVTGIVLYCGVGYTKSFMWCEERVSVLSSALP